MIMPELGPQYYDETHRDVLSRWESFYSEAITINQTFWAEADTDTRFYVGDQSLWNDIYGNLPINRRRQFNFNRIRRVVDMVSGYQRRNRKSTIITPVENGDAQTADQFTKIFMSLSNQEGILETISDSFKGSLITGMNLLQLWLDYREDPINGDMRVDNCSYNSFLIDPYFRKADLSDCSALSKRTFMTKRQAVSMMPQYAEQVTELWGRDNRDGKFQYMPESYQYYLKNLITYDEYYYRDYRTQKVVCDTHTGETMEWRGDDEKLNQFTTAHPDVTVIEQEIPTVRLAIIIQNKVFYDGPNPLGIDEYPFVPVFAYYHPETPYFPNRVQGMVRGLRDSQYLYNRRKAIELDILESQINSGWKYKENALVNSTDVYNLQGQGRGIAIKEEALMTDVEQIIAPSVPPSMIQLSEILGREIGEISGVNEELLGSAQDDKAGILSMLRQGAGLTTLQGLFDNLDHAQKILGKLMLEVIQLNYTPGKIKKILEGQEPTEQFYNKNFGKYDCVVEEGLNTSTQKQMNFAQLLQLREVGVPIPTTELLDAATIQNKKQLIDAIMKQEQAQAQQQQQQTQLAMEELKARTELAHARANADNGLGIERLSRVEENKALAEERRAAAVKDQDQGVLDMVKALKEIDALDLAHLEKLLAIASGLKERSKLENETSQSRPEGQAA